MVEINPRIQERRIEIIRAKGKRRLRILLTVVLSVLLSLAAVLISKSSLLDVDEVVVVGADSELEELIVAIANIPKSKPILEVDTQSILERIKRIPNIKVGSNTEQYIDELSDYTNIKNKKIVAYDPNLSDLIYCVDDDSKDTNEFRYTQDSRRKECKIKKYAKIILEFKKEKIDGKTIIEYETELSKLNRKTLLIKDFKEYIKKKSEINDPNNMSPLEAVTHLFASIQIADQQASYEEKESWINAITKLFPEYSEDRAEKFFAEAHDVLATKNPEKRNEYITAVLNRMKELLNSEQLSSIGPLIADIVEADGIVMTSEMEIVTLSEKILDINIKVEE